MHDFALGGTERIATRLAARWAEEGAKVTIFCGSGDGDMRAVLGDRAWR
jgi:NAD(P)-dependent dehydrogenase (short-subunit alcohol dehydrogenase family)